MEFLKENLKRYQFGEVEGDERVFLIFDNAVQHTAGITRDYFGALPFVSLTVPPYTPEMNPVEKLIGAMKKKLLTLKSSN